MMPSVANPCMHVFSLADEEWVNSDQLRVARGRFVGKQEAILSCGHAAGVCPRRYMRARVCTRVHILFSTVSSSSSTATLVHIAIPE